MSYKATRSAHVNPVRTEEEREERHVVRIVRNVALCFLFSFKHTSCTQRPELLSLYLKSGVAGSWV